MAKTTNALKILKNRAKKDRELQQLYEEEKIHHKIAMTIRAAREKKGLTQAQLAKAIGTTQSVISRLEDADYEGHSLTLLQRIAAVLGRKLEVSMPVWHSVKTCAQVGSHAAIEHRA